MSLPPSHDSAEIRDGFRFRGGNAALDLTATLAGRRTGKLRDLLAVPRDLARWLRASGLAREVADCDVEALESARRLREAIYLLAQARLSRSRLPAAARKIVNALAAAPTPLPRLDAAGASVRTGDAFAFLSQVAREAIDLLGGGAGDRIRQCEGATCAILFVDGSRRGDRRWCSMTACGNRAKVAEFRRRIRLAGQPSRRGLRART